MGRSRTSRKGNENKQKRKQQSRETETRGDRVNTEIDRKIDRETETIEANEIEG